jgi:trans-aconitate methyltransferase
MADQFPSAIVTGTDLSPIQPSWLPPNCKFYVDDAETEWNWEHKFDFIHCRDLNGGIADKPKLYGEIFKNLQPGGWLEIQEFESWSKSDDGTDQDAVWIKEWLAELDRAGSILGKTPDAAHKQVEWIREAGFEDVREFVFKVGCQSGNYS